MIHQALIVYLSLFYLFVSPILISAGPMLCISVPYYAVKVQQKNQKKLIFCGSIIGIVFNLKDL